MEAMTDPGTIYHEEEISGYPVVYQRGNDVRRWGIRLRSILVNADDGMMYHVEYVLVPFLHPLVVRAAIAILRKRATRYLSALAQAEHDGEEAKIDG